MIALGAVFEAFRPGDEPEIEEISVEDDPWIIPDRNGDADRWILADLGHTMQDGRWQTVDMRDRFEAAPSPFGKPEYETAFRPSFA